MMVAAVTMRMKRDSLINNIDSKLISNKLTFTTSNKKNGLIGGGRRTVLLALSN